MEHRRQAAGAAPDDVGFIADLIERSLEAAASTRTRIYATGVSNGGGMAARLGCELSEKLRAIAPVAGGYSALPPCAPAKPISVLEIHGTARPDRAVRGQGAGPGRKRPRLHPRLAEPGRLRARIDPHARRRARWCASTGGPAAPGTVVAHLKLIGGGHEWPRRGPSAATAGRAVGVERGVAVLRRPIAGAVTR